MKSLLEIIDETFKAFHRIMSITKLSLSFTNRNTESTRLSPVSRQDASYLRLIQARVILASRRKSILIR